MRSTAPISKDLVLIGGGHSHAIALRMMAMDPIDGLRVTLISDQSHVPYSGMLHGYVTGIYSYDDSHIDLRALANFAGANFIRSRVVGLSPSEKRVVLAERPEISFDIASINIGSTPILEPIEGAEEFAIPIKPVPVFLRHWDKIVEKVQRAPKEPFTIAVVGGGAGGVELCLAIHKRLEKIVLSHTDSSEHINTHLVHSGASFLDTHSPQAGALIEPILRNNGIQVVLEETVVEIDAHGLSCESGTRINADAVICVTGARPAAWIAESGLAVDARGFIEVGETLESISHPGIFAAGDIANMAWDPRPKSGVFAVRQGKPLMENLQAAALGKTLRRYAPQKNFLSLVSTADGSALALRNSTAKHGKALWWLKDYIDRKFMRRFSKLPVIDMSSESHRPQIQDPEFLELKAHAEMRCLGCAAKVGSSALHDALHKLRERAAANGVSKSLGFSTTEDAATVEVPSGETLLQTIDYFPAMLSDPYVFGQIAVNHAFNDVFAMGAKPIGALALAILPYSSDAKRAELLFQMLSGALDAMTAIGAKLLGGHTAEGGDLALGFTCNGSARREDIIEKQGLQPGDALVLNKQLGIGVLFAAEMRRKARGRWIDGAIASMLHSNHVAADVLRECAPRALTDVTGFGFLGHLSEMLPESGVRIKLQLPQFHPLEGSLEMFEAGIASSLQPKNLAAEYLVENATELANDPRYSLLFDPQTSGGLLTVLPREDAERAVSLLQKNGYNHASVVGYVESSSDSRSTVLCEK